MWCVACGRGRFQESCGCGPCGRVQSPPPYEVSSFLRVLVTVMNYATIGDLKKSLISTAGLSVQSDLVLMAEVKDCAVVRVMVCDHVMRSVHHVTCPSCDLSVM